MRLIADKPLRYPFDITMEIQPGESFEAPDGHAKTLILAGLAHMAPPKREYKRRDMKAEDLRTTVIAGDK